MKKTLIIITIISVISFLGIWQYGKKIEAECVTRYEKAMKDNAEKIIINERTINEDVKKDVVTLGNTGIREWLRANSTYKD